MHPVELVLRVVWSVGFSLIELLRSTWCGGFLGHRSDAQQHKPHLPVGHAGHDRALFCRLPA